MLRLGLRRFLLVSAIAALFVFALGEAAFYFLRQESDREPQEIRLVIPQGTARRVESGQAEPSLPAEMSFVVGDVLVVENRDQSDHQLGPVYIPAGTSASLNLEQVSHFDYACSFQPSQYLGLTVRERTTLNIRLIALAYVTPGMAIFLFVYSLALFPLQKKDSSSTDVPGPDSG